MKHCLSLILLLIVFVGCNDKTNEELKIISKAHDNIAIRTDSIAKATHVIYELHEKYRTLWYRTNKKCFYDSSKKYGQLYNLSIGIKEPNFSIDTTTLNEPTPDCK